MESNQSYQYRHQNDVIDIILVSNIVNFEQMSYIVLVFPLLAFPTIYEVNHIWCRKDAANVCVCVYVHPP